MLQPEILEKEQAIIPILRLAFRPFFLLPALLSIVAVLVWIMVLKGNVSWHGALPANVWHGHEMTFGFAGSVAVGFLLSAAQTWTGVRSINGWKLAVTLFFWLSARAALLSSSTSLLIYGVICEGLWWLCSISYLAYMVIKSNNRRNLIFIPLLSIIMMLDLTTILSALMVNASLASHLSYSAVFMMTCVVTVVGGRVIPFFTTRALNLPSIKGNLWLERTIAGLMFTVFLCFGVSYFLPITTLLAILLITTGCLQMVRMLSWQSFKTIKTPLLWSLHLSYLNMGIGFIMVGISYFAEVINFSSAIHIVTIGTIGTMIIAMMSRVSLGHTGRALQINGWVSCSFISLLAATLARFLMPTLNWTMSGYILAASCWVVGFSIFVFYYTPILLTARPDGRSG
jgi:uncharacterized protein involved in response to NO